MKKILGLLAIACVPLFASAQMYNYRTSAGYESMGVPTFLALFLPIILALFQISIFIFWLIMLIDAIKNAPGKMKLIWVVVIVFTWAVGSLLYYFIVYRPRICKTCGQVVEKKNELKEE